MNNSIINTQTKDINAHMIDLWYTIPYFHLCFVYARADILINSLVSINHCTQDKRLHIYPMEDHFYPYKIWFDLICPVGTGTTNFDFLDNSHDSQQHETDALHAEIVLSMSPVFLRKIMPK